MSRGAGFAAADVDVNFFRDLRIKRLAREFPLLFPVASLAYVGIVLHCWDCGERQTAADAWPELVPWSEEAVSALRTVGLLDRTTRVRKQAWDDWFGVAFARREERRVAGAFGGHQKASNRLAKLQQSPSTATAELQQSPSSALPGPSVPSVPPDSPKPPKGASVKPRKGPRSNGTSPRQLERGDAAVDSKAMASLEERAAAWNAAHPTDRVPLPGGLT